MRTMTKGLITASLIAVGGAASAQMATIENADQLSPDATIAENASKVQNFSTLLAAAEAAGLTDELAGPGPYTVFAPTDEAFAKLPEGTVDDLLKPENMASLETLLRAHIVPGVVTAADLASALDGVDPTSTAPSLRLADDKVIADTLTTSEDIYFDRNGDAIELAAETEGMDVVTPEARIIATDITSSNGVIHVIDGVLLPQS